MMRTDPWYEVVQPDTKLTQGDLIFNCPLLTWNTDVALHHGVGQEGETLRQAATAFRADVVVMTQACDLEHDKVRSVVLCPHVALSEFRTAWEQAMQQAGQNATAKAWRSTLMTSRTGTSGIMRC